MKKLIAFALILICCMACGPKRMKCYGKRCVILHTTEVTKPVPSTHS